MENIIAKPIVNGFSFTYTTFALQYLNEAEEKYGHSVSFPVFWATQK